MNLMPEYKFKFEEFTAQELRILKEKNTLIVLSLGSLEQHGPHLPVGTDFLCSKSRTERICKATSSILLSPLMPGYSYAHKGMDGTIFLRAETLHLILIDIFISLASQGWKRLIIFSGHAGNWPIVEVTSNIVRESYHNFFIAHAKGYPKLDPNQYKERFVKKYDYHAGVVETALLNFDHPTLLQFSQIPHELQSLPIALKAIGNNMVIDDVDELLSKTLMPAHTSKLSENGVWGLSDVRQYTTSCI
jgi:creatinine amidohydrolase